jgi:hypothetical protein
MMKRTLMILALSLFTAVALAEEPRAIKKAGEGIEKGEAAAGRGIEKGEAAAGRGIKKAAKHPVHGITKAGNWIGKKVGKKGAEKHEKAGE